MADMTGQPPKALDMIILDRYVSIYSQARNHFLGGPICVDMRIDMTNRYAPLDMWCLYRFHISVISSKSHHISRLTISTKRHHIDHHISIYCAYIENGGI